MRFQTKAFSKFNVFYLLQAEAFKESSMQTKIAKNTLWTLLV